MNFSDTCDWLEERLKRDLPGESAHQRMLARVRAMPEKVPEHARASAVLGLLFPKDDTIHLLLIKRTEDGRAHSGQISFPGGRMEQHDADLRATALRETQEEVGISSGNIRMIGQLSRLYIPVSNFLVYPFIGMVDHHPAYQPNHREVAAIIEVPLPHLLGTNSKVITAVTSPADKSFIKDVRAYQLQDGTIIWGATAMILSELEVLVSEGLGPTLKAPG